MRIEKAMHCMACGEIYDVEDGACPGCGETEPSLSLQDELALLQMDWEVLAVAVRAADAVGPYNNSRLKTRMISNLYDVLSNPLDGGDVEEPYGSA